MNQQSSPGLVPSVSLGLNNISRESDRSQVSPNWAQLPNNLFD